MQKCVVRQAQVQARMEVYGHYKYHNIEKPIYCSLCGSESVLEMHHNNYYKPLEVEFLCRSCHAKRHCKNHPLYVDIVYPEVMKDTSAKTNRSRGVSQSIPKFIKYILKSRGTTFRKWCIGHGLNSSGVVALFAGRTLGLRGEMKRASELLDKEFPCWKEDVALPVVTVEPRKKKIK
ncbi:MAG: hypothetical protein WCI45_03135 [Desulfuromonadales bacterium]